jgi:hypothetical protein
MGGGCKAWRFVSTEQPNLHALVVDGSYSDVPTDLESEPISFGVYCEQHTDPIAEADVEGRRGMAEWLHKHSIPFTQDMPAIDMVQLVVDRLFAIAAFYTKSTNKTPA